MQGPAALAVPQQQARQQTCCTSSLQRAQAPVSGGLFLSQRGGETSTTSTTTAVSASSTRVGMLGGSAPGASPAARPPTAPGGTAMSRLSAELEAVRNNWRAEGSVTRSKMMDLHHAKIRAEEALHEAKASAKAAAIKATQREDSLKAEISSLRSALDSVQRERARQEQEWLSQAGTFRRNIEALREQAGELDKEIQTVEAGRQAALARAEAAEAQNRGLEGNLQSLRQDITRLEVVLSETRSAASQEASGQRAEAEAAAAAHVRTAMLCACAKPCRTRPCPPPPLAARRSATPAGPAGRAKAQVLLSARRVHFSAHHCRPDRGEPARIHLGCAGARRTRRDGI